MSLVQSLPVTIESVVDGDTLHVVLTHDVPPPFDITLIIRRKLRLSGLNCAELSTPAGVVAKDFTKQWLVSHVAPYSLQTKGRAQDKYSDRIDARLVAADGHCLNDDLLAAGQAIVVK